MYGTHAPLWKVAELLRNLLLTCIITMFLDTGSALQIAFALVVSAFAHVAHAVWKPFVNRGSYLLQHGSLGVTTLVYALGLMFKMQEFTRELDAGAGADTTAGDGDTGLSQALGVTLVLLCSAFLSVGAIMVATTVCYRARAQLRARRERLARTPKRRRRRRDGGGSDGRGFTSGMELARVKSMSPMSAASSAGSSSPSAALTLSPTTSGSRRGRRGTVGGASPATSRRSRSSRRPSSMGHDDVTVWTHNPFVAPGESATTRSSAGPLTARSPGSVEDVTAAARRAREARVASMRKP